MKIDEIKKILAAIAGTDVTEFELQRGEDKLRIRRGQPGEPSNSGSNPYIVVTSGFPAGQLSAPAGNAPPRQAQDPPAGAEEASEETSGEDLTIVTSPIVGTFYEGPSPGAPAFVEVGDKVEAGQVLCIIEAMKLMNEIESETAGVIEKRFVSNAQPVEYGEALFAIRRQ
jgi:acetyl-CoA carboxylase biotin carboxyl carrier protein